MQYLLWKFIFYTTFTWLCLNFDVLFTMTNNFVTKLFFFQTLFSCLQIKSVSEELKKKYENEILFNYV